MYTCLFLNDDYTPMVFVIQVLTGVFNLSVDDATAIMLKIHIEGKANVGSYTFEVASHKADVSMALARQNQFPLLVSPEAI
jgi:ATP-dependent Clp protease adaptor protein ClpS